MDADIKTQWIGALRSGRYRQGKGNLRWQAIEERYDTFCCLGVLCDLVKERLSKGVWVHNADSRYTFVTHKDMSTSTLPGPVKDLAGLDRAQCETLMRLNDCGSSFEDIARYIQAEL